MPFVPVLCALAVSLLAALTTLCSYFQRENHHMRMIFNLSLLGVLYTGSYLIYMGMALTALDAPDCGIAQDEDDQKCGFVGIDSREWFRSQDPLTKLACVTALTSEMVFLAWTGCISHYCAHGTQYSRLKAEDDHRCAFNRAEWEMQSRWKYKAVAILNSDLNRST